MSRTPRERSEPSRRTQDSAETVAVQLEVETSTGEVTVSVRATEGDAWQPVAEDVVREGLLRLFRRESRFERTAARFGLPADTLLESLEDSVVDLTDDSDGVPEAELQALADAGIHLEGSATDPSGAVQVALGQSRFHRFREEARTVSEAAKVLKVSTSRVRQLISSGEVVTIPSSEGHLLPAWQFVGGRLLPGLPDLVDATRGVHPLTVAAFMERSEVDLEVQGEPVSPTQWLLGGGDVRVVADLITGLDLPS